MAGQLPGYLSHHKAQSIASSKYLQEDPQSLRRWYFSREEIEKHSPSRKDGIDYEKESGLRKLYCSFLQELGIELKVPQVTIATAMLLCHQFYMRQSHTKNHWQIIATVSMFLACKAEETPRWLADLVVVSYKLIYKWDPSAPQRIRDKEVYDKQKELILVGERLLLSTVAYELNIEHPYKPLVAAIKRLEISHKELAKVAWNFVNDWLRSTLCLQYKPHYIAAGSLFLAAKFLKVKLPTEKGKTWWMQFDVSPKQLEDVVQQMLHFLENNHSQAVPPKCGRSSESRPAIGKGVSSNTESCISSGSVIAPAASSTAMVDTGGLLKNAISENGNAHSSTVGDSVKQKYQKQAVPLPSGRPTELRRAIGRDVSRTMESCISSGSVAAQGCSSSAMAETGQLPKSVISKNSTAQSSITIGSAKENNQNGGSTQSEAAVGKAVSHSKKPCVSSSSVIAQDSSCTSMVQTGVLPKSVISRNSSVPSNAAVESINEKEHLDSSDCGSANSVVEDGSSEPRMGQAKQEPCNTVSAEEPKRKIDVHRIKETLKRRKLDKTMHKKVEMDDEIDSEAWIERELEKPCNIVCAEEPKRKIDVHRIKETLKRRKLDRTTHKKVGMDNEIDSEAWIERELENLE
nr:cyclin-T1-3-like [Ipomoea batatas]GME06138.1 cyclin-T1-3-like [Ipomoea batatas]